MHKNNIRNDFVTVVKVNSNYLRQVRPTRRDLFPPIQCIVARGDTTWEIVLQNFPDKAEIEFIKKIENLFI